MSGARRKVTHLGKPNAQAACGNWIGTKAKYTQDPAEVTCSGCLRAMEQK